MIRLAHLIFASVLVTACDQSPTLTPDKEHPQVYTGIDYLPDGWPSKTLPEISAALQSGEITSENIVLSYLNRIKKVDRTGPTLQSILWLNPDALSQARQRDRERESGVSLGPLHGVPILLKDNIESKDAMPTTAGSLALKDNITGRDSPLVNGLRSAGAVILGKTNLSEWAYYRSASALSGWSALGGQVRNPHMLDRTPCGSSSGSAAAMAASLAAGTVGTETDGSIICPANANGIVGFKPTIGLVSQDYIVPISPTQDTAGPMTKTVTGAAMMLSAMATGSKEMDYAAGLNSDALRGVRVGVLRFAQGSNVDIHGRFSQALFALQEAGAVLVDINEDVPTPDNFSTLYDQIQDHEFKTTLNAYLSTIAPNVKTRSLTDLIAFNEENAEIELALFGQDWLEGANEMTGLDHAEYQRGRETLQRAMGVDGIDELLSEYDVQVLVAPSGELAPRIDPVNGDVWPDEVGAGSMAAIAGYPHLTVPMGTVDNIPIGLSFMGASGRDADVLSFGYAYEQHSQMRAEPEYLRDAESIPNIAKAMKPAVLSGN